jgi:hypothetical protein
LLREIARRQLPLRVALIDRHGRQGLGQAYSTTHPAHLLNSPASTMSALTGDPDHLTQWVEQAGIRHDGFLPRSAYGRYLSDLLAQAERAALPAVRVSHITSEVVAPRRCSCGRALRLHLAADGRIDAKDRQTIVVLDLEKRFPAAHFIASDKETGKVRWKTPRSAEAAKKFAKEFNFVEAYGPQIIEALEGSLVESLPGEFNSPSIPHLDPPDVFDADKAAALGSLVLDDEVGLSLDDFLDYGGCLRASQKEVFLSHDRATSNLSLIANDGVGFTGLTEGDLFPILDDVEPGVVDGTANRNFFEVVVPGAIKITDVDRGFRRTIEIGQSRTRLSAQNIVEFFDMTGRERFAAGE